MVALFPIMSVCCTGTYRQYWKPPTVLVTGLLCVAVIILKNFNGRRQSSVHPGAKPFQILAPLGLARNKSYQLLAPLEPSYFSPWHRCNWRGHD